LRPYLANYIIIVKGETKLRGSAKIDQFKTFLIFIGTFRDWRGFLTYGLENQKNMIKYTIQFLTKLEDLIAESDYALRYEKGNFKSGYCLLKDQKIMIINKFFTTEGKINALLEILKGIKLDPTRFTEKSIKLYDELGQQQSEVA
jgi:hypothetical protein